MPVHGYDLFGDHLRRRACCALRLPRREQREGTVQLCCPVQRCIMWHALPHVTRDPSCCDRQASCLSPDDHMPWSGQEAAACGKAAALRTDVADLRNYCDW